MMRAVLGRPAGRCGGDRMADVEGVEGRVLSGMTETLRTRPLTIVRGTTTEARPTAS